MYRFQVHAVTEPGETIALVGSTSAMGMWDIAQCVRLQTSGDRYPIWWVDVDLDEGSCGPSDDRFSNPKVEYNYVRLRLDNVVEWESLSTKRWVPIETESLPSSIIVEDGVFGTIPSYPYGYFAEALTQEPTPNPEGLKILVIGSSVALGCSAWLLRGWAWHLGRTLQQKYGHQLVNRSELGATVSTTIAQFSNKVISERPDIVIIALSLGNEGLASSAPCQRPAIQRHFENGLKQLVKMTEELGARPILGGVYPRGDYSSGNCGLLRETNRRMLTWGVPVLNWLALLEAGQGQWKDGISFDKAHPNTIGHRLMYDAIDLTLFQDVKEPLKIVSQPQTLLEDNYIYHDESGFEVVAYHSENGLRLSNNSPHPYHINSDWQQLQTAIQSARLSVGLYVAEGEINDHSGEQLPATLLYLFIRDNGAIEANFSLAPGATLIFYPVFYFFSPQRSNILFYDGHLGILNVKTANGDVSRRLYIINKSDNDYNLQPMWKELRAALKAMPSGLYEDPSNADAPFRTLMIGLDGLESRVKSPARSAMLLDYKCSLSDVSRVAIIPLGDRCAIRMLLYKLEYDGPAFPFDLARSTNLADVADMVNADFQDMWNPDVLQYNHDARRIYHQKWTGLSFAHEVEDSDDPVHDMTPVHQRMFVRYSARAQRFSYAINACDQVLFVRTGLCDRGAVVDLVQKLETKYNGKPFRLLIVSPQSSDEFANLSKVLHYNFEFNPDRMYDNLDHWLYCTEFMGVILKDLGVSSKNLFWCPPTIPKGG